MKIIDVERVLAEFLDKANEFHSVVVALDERRQRWLEVTSSFTLKKIDPIRF